MKLEEVRLGSRGFSLNPQRWQRVVSSSTLSTSLWSSSCPVTHYSSHLIQERQASSSHPVRSMEYRSHCWAEAVHLSCLGVTKVKFFAPSFSFLYLDPFPLFFCLFKLISLLLCLSLACISLSLCLSSLLLRILYLPFSAFVHFIWTHYKHATCQGMC